MKVAFLWGGWQPPLHACAEELVARGHPTLAVATFRSARSPYDAESWQGTYQRCELGPGHEPDVAATVNAFRPDVVLVSGWNNRAHIRAAKAARASGAMVGLCMDNQWREAPKQWLGRATSPLVIRPVFDFALVPGERQAQFAQRLGFRGRDIMTGLFVRPPDSDDVAPSAQNFLYLGAREERKGFSTTLRAYQRYRREAEEPWNLVLAGAGRRISEPGIIDLGFLSCRAEVVSAMQRTCCTIMVGRREAYGIALLEAAAAGHVLIAAHTVGAVPHIVQDWYNGRTVEPDAPDQLSHAMLSVHGLASSEIVEWSRRSRELAGPYSATRWVRRLEEVLRR